MKKTKMALIFLAASAFIAVCVNNFILGLSDYDNISTSLLTLEALADGEGGSEENSTILYYCINFKSEYRNVGTTSAPIFARCCVNGTDIEYCIFSYEDSRCAGKVNRNSHSNCQGGVIYIPQ
jgi:hypothetical protein